MRVTSIVVSRVNHRVHSAQGSGFYVLLHVLCVKTIIYPTVISPRLGGYTLTSFVEIRSTFPLILLRVPRLSTNDVSTAAGALRAARGRAAGIVIPWSKATKCLFRSSFLEAVDPQLFSCARLVSEYNAFLRHRDARSPVPSCLYPVSRYPVQQSLHVCTSHVPRVQLHRRHVFPGLSRLRRLLRPPSPASCGILGCGPFGSCGGNFIMFQNGVGTRDLGMALTAGVA